jgi:hypothetical protein
MGLHHLGNRGISAGQSLIGNFMLLTGTPAVHNLSRSLIM